VPLILWFRSKKCDFNGVSQEGNWILSIQSSLKNKGCKIVISFFDLGPKNNEYLKGNWKLITSFSAGESSEEDTEKGCLGRFLHQIAYKKIPLIGLHELPIWWLPEKKNLIIVCLENEVANSMWQLQSWFVFSKGSLNYSYVLRISHHSYQLDDDSKQKLNFPLMDDPLTSQIQHFDFIGVERFMNSFRFILMYWQFQVSKHSFSSRNILGFGLSWS
jgi:hypothetical protein